jgi:hypothetical protein
MTAMSSGSTTLQRDPRLEHRTRNASSDGIVTARALTSHDGTAFDRLADRCGLARISHAVAG